MTVPLGTPADRGLVALDGGSAQDAPLTRAWTPPPTTSARSADQAPVTRRRGRGFSPGSQLTPRPSVGTAPACRTCWTSLASGQRTSDFFFNDTATTEIYTLSLHVFRS